MTEDILHRNQTQFPEIQIQFNDDMYHECLILIEDKLHSISRKSLQDYGFPTLDRDKHVPLGSDYLKETTYDVEGLLSYVQENEQRLLDCQCTAYLTILNSVEENMGILIFSERPMRYWKNIFIKPLISQSYIKQTYSFGGSIFWNRCHLTLGGRNCSFHLQVALKFLFC